MTFMQLASAIHGHNNNWIHGVAEHTLSELRAMSLKQLQSIWAEWNKEK